MPCVVFVHPDLGIGGAERLIVDAALALQEEGHDVHIFTAHHDKNHCFDETRDGTLRVKVYGDFLPRSLLGYFHAACAYLRMVILSLFLLFTTYISPDVIVCDQISVSIPILKLKSSKVIFYCHFPDKLLSQPGGVFKKYYRSVMDKFEEASTRQATKIFVNSQFTSSVFRKSFKSIRTIPDVLYPSLHTKKFDRVHTIGINEIISKRLPPDTNFFLSLNRYERKKNIGLSVAAFDSLRSTLSSEKWENCHLIIAGGYDANLLENIEHYSELEDLIASYDLEDKVTLLKSPGECEKISLLKNSICLLYTPSNEHFGIVPLESMYLETPVIAVNSGGPTESVLDGKTGFLREPFPDKFADVMRRFVNDKQLSKKMGALGRERVNAKFSFEHFSKQLNNAIKGVI